MIEGSGKDASVAVLFSKFDRMKVERVVGSKRVERMCLGEKDAFMFT